MQAERIDLASTIELRGTVQRNKRVGVGDLLAGRYRLIRLLGVGGMGWVFEAEDGHVGRPVAVKVVKPVFAADVAQHVRFVQEAKAIAAVEHRNTARFLDLIVGDPTFLVMELVHGPTLQSVLESEEQLDPVRAINLARRLCWALNAVHAAGIIHRDIKPANILLARDPELGEEPKLIDFGLAKLRSEAGVTPPCTIVGTPHYMAPEQIALDEVDARSDVYSLGCVLYHMVAGAPPFYGDERIFDAKLRREPLPIAAFAPHAPAQLDEVLRRALARDPAERFQSMRELHDALATIDRRRPPRRKWWSR
jgi:serine/threonine-protein kinase